MGGKTKKGTEMNVDETRSDYPPPYSLEAPVGPGPPPGPPPELQLGVPLGSPPGPYYYHGAVITQAPSYVHHSVAGATTVVVTQSWSPKPTRTTCKYCNYEILTRVQGKTATKTHVCAGILCLLGCWCCVWCPYCGDTCKNIDHYCPNCSAYLGGYFI